VVEERDSTNTLLASYVSGLFADEHLLRVDGEGNAVWYVADEQFNVVALTDGAGAVLERYEYGDYGEPFVTDASGDYRGSSYHGNAYMFTGRRWEPEIGFYFYRARYYDPYTGRFVSRDPIGIWGDPAGLGNGYAYAGNNPWTFVDPTGLAAKQVYGKMDFSRPFAPGFMAAQGLQQWNAERRDYWLRSVDADPRLRNQLWASAWMTSNDFGTGALADMMMFGSDYGSLEERMRGKGPLAAYWEIQKTQFSEGTRALSWAGAVGSGVSTLNGAAPRLMNTSIKVDTLGTLRSTGSNGASIRIKIDVPPANSTGGPPGTVYRQLSAEDRAALDAGESLQPRGEGGTILDHVRAKATGHISASETMEGTARFNGGNGLVAIDVQQATAGGTRFISHGEVLDGVANYPKQVMKAAEAREVLFEGGIPASAVTFLE